MRLDSRGAQATICDRHMHLHVISADLTAPAMKKKKHYNSFHPKLGFFLHLEDIVSLFDAEPSYFDTVRPLSIALSRLIGSDKPQLYHLFTDPLAGVLN